MHLGISGIPGKSIKSKFTFGGVNTFIYGTKEDHGVSSYSPSRYHYLSVQTVVKLAIFFVIE